MYDFHYKYIKQWYWPNARLLFTRTNTVHVIRSKQKPFMLSGIRPGSFSTFQSTQLITPSTSRPTRKSLENERRHFSRSQSLWGCGKKCTASPLSSTKARKPIVWRRGQKTPDLSFRLPPEFDLKTRRDLSVKRGLSGPKNINSCLSRWITLDWAAMTTSGSSRLIEKPCFRG